MQFEGWHLRASTGGVSGSSDFLGMLGTAGAKLLWILHPILQMALRGSRGHRAGSELQRDPEIHRVLWEKAWKQGELPASA